MNPISYDQIKFYELYQVFLYAPDIRDAFGEFDIRGDMVFFEKYNHSMDLSNFTKCKTVEDMVPIVRESLAQKTKEDQMIRLRNSIFLVVGCIIAFTVMWYAKT